MRRAGIPFLLPPPSLFWAAQASKTFPTSLPETRSSSRVGGWLGGGGIHLQASLLPLARILLWCGCSPWSESHTKARSHLPVGVGEQGHSLPLFHLGFSSGMAAAFFSCTSFLLIIISLSMIASALIKSLKSHTAAISHSRVGAGTKTFLPSSPV